MGCASDGERISRHDRLRDIIFQHARDAALSPVMEKNHITLTNSKPGDIFLPVWRNGRPSAFDVTVTSSLQSSTINAAGIRTGAALTVAEDRKISKHFDSCREVGVDFVPLAVEVLGGWSQAAVDHLVQLASRAADRRGKPRSQVKTYMFQKLSLYLQCEPAD